MPRVRCHYVDCVFLEDGYCGAPAVEIDPDEGCMTYSRIDDLPSDEDWDDEELEEVWEVEEYIYADEDDEDDDWLEEDSV